MIRVGIGGWTYEPWRGTFYPADLKQADELNYASRHLTTIEINGTFYRTQSAASFQKWREEILLNEATPTVFADLGYGVLDSAMVEVAAYCLQKQTGVSN